jgi:outer membrane protein assembly factor BamB
MVFLGLNARVAALDRLSGRVLWSWQAEKGGKGFVALLVDRDRLIASISGYTYCLDALTGQELWFNPLEGFGLGTPCVATTHGSTLSSSAVADDDDDDRPAEAPTTS